MAHDDGRFDRPRIYAAGGLILTACLLLLADVISPDYMVGDVTVTILLGIAVTLLGVEISDTIRRNGR